MASSLLLSPNGVMERKDSVSFALGMSGQILPKWPNLGRIYKVFVEQANKELYWIEFNLWINNMALR